MRVALCGVLIGLVWTSVGMAEICGSENSDEGPTMMPRRASMGRADIEIFRVDMPEGLVQPGDELTYFWSTTGGFGESVNDVNGVETTEDRQAFIVTSGDSGRDTVSAEVFALRDGQRVALGAATAEILIEQGRKSIIHGSWDIEVVPSGEERSCTGAWMYLPKVDGASQYDLYAYGFNDTLAYGTEIVSSWGPDELPRTQFGPGEDRGGEWAYGLSGICSPNSSNAANEAHLRGRFGGMTVEITVTYEGDPPRNDPPEDDSSEGVLEADVLRGGAIANTSDDCVLDGRIGDVIEYEGTDWDSDGGPITLLIGSTEFASHDPPAFTGQVLFPRFAEFVIGSAPPQNRCTTSLVAKQGGTERTILVRSLPAEAILFSENADVLGWPDGGVLRPARNGTLTCIGEIVSPIGNGDYAVVLQGLFGHQSIDPGTGNLINDAYSGLWIDVVQNAGASQNQIHGGITGEVHIGLAGGRVLRRATEIVDIPSLDPIGIDRTFIDVPPGRYPGEDALLTGVLRVGGDILFPGNLHCDGIYMYIDGNVTILGNLTGVGTLVATGRMVFAGNVDFLADESLAAQRGIILGAAMPKVHIATPAAAGSTTVEVDSNNGFKPGDTALLNPGTATEEEIGVVGLGSLLLGAPLQFDHEPGELIVNISGEDPTAAAQADSAPDACGGTGCGAIMPAHALFLLLMQRGVARRRMRRRRNR